MRTLRFLSLLVLLTILGSWGFLVHRTTTQLAVYQLPNGLQPFFADNMDYLVRYSVRPDERRKSDSLEGPKHFIDIEHFDGPDATPMRWSDAVKKYGEAKLMKSGYVPYWVIEMKNRLTQAFKNGNRDSILFYATDLAHYIEDAHVPLHTTENHDGQLTGQKGLHSLWESTVPELDLEGYHLYEKHEAAYLKKPEEAIWKAIRESYALLPELFATEKEVSKNFTDSTKYRVQIRNGRESKGYSSAFARAYGEKLAPSINRQLLKSAALVSDFWYTAWVDAGKPSLDALVTTPVSAEQKSAWAQELISYKTDQLLKNGMLRSRQKGAEQSNRD